MPIPADNHDRAIDYLTIPLRLALALSFLFPVADRLGLLGPPGTPGVAWGNFKFPQLQRSSELIFASSYTTSSRRNRHSS